MKTILYLYHTSTIGGGSFCLLNILKSINRSLYKPVVLLKNYGPLVDEIERLGIKVYFLPTLSTVPYNISTFTPSKIINAYHIITSFSKYESLLSKISPDIVYLNTMMLYPYLRSAKQKGIKTIIHIREHWPENEHRHQRNLALRNIDKYADHIIGINTYSISMFDFSKKPKTIVYDWIDLSNRYERRPISEIFGESISDKKVYLFMGGMQPIKGVKQVVTTFIHCIKDSNSRLLIMGIQGNYRGKGIKATIKNILAKIGYLSYSDYVLKLINSDNRIKCIPSSYKINDIVQQSYCVLSYFTIPHANLSLAENIILGIPTIAASTSESLEYSRNGEMALLYPINNLAAFQEAVLNFDDRRSDIIKNIHSKSSQIKEMFDPQTNSEILNKLYMNL